MSEYQQPLVHKGSRIIVSDLPATVERIQHDGVAVKLDARRGSVYVLEFATIEHAITKGAEH